MSEKQLVLVTGGTGFLAAWVIASLFREGYRVRTTIRSLSRSGKVKEQLRETGISEEQISSLEIVEAELLSDNGWADAMKDVTYVQHVASPFPPTDPKHDDELIKPAREGTLRALRYARDSGSVVRVVLTSSSAAVDGRHPNAASTPFTEKDWTDLDSGSTSPYAKSKTLAERAAWDFMEKEGGKLELTVINPALVLGPAVGADISTSLLSVSELVGGSVPGVPHVMFGIVDVRDCANMHVAAMVNPGAKGERFLCANEKSVPMPEFSQILKKNLGLKGRKVPTLVLPNFLVRGIAIFLPVARQILPELGVEKVYINTKAKEVLGWIPQYSNEQAILASAETILKYGVVKV